MCSLPTVLDFELFTRHAPTTVTKRSSKPPPTAQPLGSRFAGRGWKQRSNQLLSPPVPGSRPAS